MKTRILFAFLALIPALHSAGAAPLPSGYGVGRADDGADQPVQVNYDAIVTPRGSAPRIEGTTAPAPQGIQATFTVTTTADGVPGSLRAAITSANASPGMDVIAFAIGSGYVTLAPGSQLPDIVDPVVIDGTTQPGFGGSPIVELSGASAGPNAIGLVIRAGGSIVRGLIINRWQTTGSGGFGIVLDALGNNAIEGCWIGLGADGVIARPNAVNGILIVNGSTNNRIGGTTAAQRNVLSGNASSGIQIGTGNGGFNTIQGNWIGLNAFGTGLVPNNGNGIFLNASDNTIGGTVPGARNVISGNAFPGIFIGNACQRTLVVGNYIGTDPSGGLDFGNAQNGIFVDQASNNRIGDGTFAGRNVISGNEFGGVYLFGPGTGNFVQGNFICTSASGSVALGDGTGIVLDNVTNTTVGGTTLAARNVVSGTPVTGIALINNASQNRVIGNYVGTDSTGTGPLPTLKGILLNNAPNNTIGGTASGEGNVISGNTQYGVETRGTATGIKIYGNRIGSDPTGWHPVGNLLDGIVLNSSNVEVKFGNVIAFNGRAGVFDSTGARYLIEDNSIFQNAQFGIDNMPRGLTINDDLDIDVGANDLQNFPVLDSVRITSSELRILGKLNSRPNRAYRLNFYDNETCGTAHFGEGRYIRTSVEVVTDAMGFCAFSVTSPTAVVPPNYITATATDVLDGSTSEFSQCMCLKDSDGDGIMDCWETQNWGIDINSDGVRDLDLYARGARPNHKDVFVEIDAMNGFAPPPASIQMVIDAFAQAPQDEVQNPDGLDGINLHAAVDETNITQQPLTTMFEDLELLKQTTFGTVAERNDPNSQFILAAKRLVYRYGMWVRTFAAEDGDTTSRGLGEYSPDYGGDDFVIGLGATGPCNRSGEINDVRINAGAFMHELGHTLGLDHGGANDDDQFKPNYYSVMNYTWAIPRPWAPPAGWRLDYAHRPGRDPRFIPLIEPALIESDGLVSGPGPIITVPYTDATYTVRQARAEYGVGVDWNGDGLVTGLVDPVDINEPTHGTTDCEGILDTHTSPDDALYPRSDWEALKYNFRSSPGFHPNPAVTTDGYAATRMLPTGSGFLPEPDAAQEAVLDNLPAPRPTGKFTMDGALDPSAVAIAVNDGITLYGSFKPPQLYLATNAAAAQGGDMVVLLSDARGNLRAAPLGKAGQVGAWDATLFGRATGDPSAWADGGEAPLTSVTVDSSAAVLEGVVDVGLLFGENPPNLYLALAKYAPGTGGALLAQAPAGDGDGNVDGGEFLSLSGAVSVQPTPGAPSRRVNVELIGAHPALRGARFRLTLESASDVDVSLQNVAGRRVASLAHGTYEAGVHEFSVDEGLAAGVYFLVTRAFGETRATRVIIVR